MVAIQIGDTVKITGGSAHVGQTGILKTKTKVMAAVELHESGITVKKKKKFLKKIPPATVEEDVPNENVPPPRRYGRTLAELANARDKTTAVSNDVLITVPSITTNNMHAILETATESIEALCGKGSIDGNGIVHRNMKELKFKFKGSAQASLFVTHFKSSDLVLQGQVCSVSFAEPGKVAPPHTAADNYALHSRKRPALEHDDLHPRKRTAFGRSDEEKKAARHNHALHSRKRPAFEHANGESMAALPAGRSLFDRLQDGPASATKRQRRW